MIAATQSNHPLATVSGPAPAGSAMNEARERIRLGVNFQEVVPLVRS